MTAFDNTDTELAAQLVVYKDELESELNRILDFWQDQMVDARGGFYGSMNNNNEPALSAEKGVVLNSRILWTFSAAFRYKQEEHYRKIADRAWEYLQAYFVDRQAGGVFWSVAADGSVANGKKQLYGQAFYVYGLAEYYKINNDPAVLHAARATFRLMETYGLDQVNGGYWEAFTKEWGVLEDLRLSNKDENAPKTMNTHLHIIEAYANLYTVWPDQQLGNAITNLLAWFDQHIIDHNTQQLRLFMQPDWSGSSATRSFGHDIEAAWLLYECAEIIGDQYWISCYRSIAIALARSTRKGLDADGGLWYEWDRNNDHWIREKHWWPQAEAMVGFFNAWQLSGEVEFLRDSLHCWQFTREHLLDQRGGEWFWGKDAANHILPMEKAGFWKCPYHNGRACLEIIRRISATV